MLGSTKHNITLTAHDETGPFVKDLSDALTEVTGVPQTSQKIIFKGRFCVPLCYSLITKT